jgi:hypothetical protein
MGFTFGYRITGGGYALSRHRSPPRFSKNMKIIQIIKKVFWVITGRCHYCGGKTEMWDLEHEYCLVCGKRI